jgi:hypothetical protein
MPPVVYLFWASIVVSLGVALVAVRLSTPRLALAAVVLGTPFLLYLVGTPRFGPIASVVLPTYYATPLALRHGDNRLALACAVQCIAFIGFIVSVLARAE